jgi:hypothetical protein
MAPEPFVSAEEAVKYVPVKRRYLLALARRGIAGAYPLDPASRRRRWMFRLSELTEAISKTTIHNSRDVCDPASNLGGSR